MAWLTTRPISFIGGCVIPQVPRIVPAKPGVLILMNHQSLFDIPLVVQTVEGGYPRIVTRARYTKWIPVISHMIRLYQYPVVDPSANAAVMRDTLDELERTALATTVPIAVFPEGTRTRDGDIGRFKRGGLSRLLAARTWTVYVFVADGFWKAAKFKHFLSRLGLVRGQMEHVATLEWTDPGADSTEFLEEVREMMQARLTAMREASAA
jgi:1-acyl-sn-glycerol-3-phosphate acyltransferase